MPQPKTDRPDDRHFLLATAPPSRRQVWLASWMLLALVAVLAVTIPLRPASRFPAPKGCCPPMPPRC